VGEQVRVRVAYESFDTAPRPAVPLQYAGPDVSRLWKQRALAVLELLGGPYQLLWAAGLACVGSGIGQWEGFGGSGDAAAFLGFGGLFLGLAIPVPRRKA
jgi:hypothetical protein